MAFGAVVIISLFVLFLPNDDVPSGFPPGTDKVVHGLLFGALAFTGLKSGVRPVRLLPVLAAYAVVSELVQSVPALGRSSDPVDVVADCVGVALGWLVWVNIRRYRR